jgi:hypothetical protein
MASSEIIKRISSSLRSSFLEFRSSVSGKWAKFNDDPKIIIERIRNTPTSRKITIGSICVALPLLIYTMTIKTPPVQKPAYVPPTSSSPALQVSELIEARHTRRSIICSFSTELALRFEYDGDEIANHLKKRSKELVLAQVSELVPFPKEEQKKPC